MESVNSPNGQPVNEAKFVLTITYNRDTKASGYAVGMDPDFPLDTAVMDLEKVKFRVMSTILNQESQQIARAKQKQRQGQVEIATQMPPPPNISQR